MKKRLLALILALCLCVGLSVPSLAASRENEDNSSINVYVTELEAGYYLCAVWDGDKMLCLFDYTVSSDGILKTTVDIGETLPTGTQVTVGISSANAGGKEIAPVVCSAYNPSTDTPAKPSEPAKPTETLYYISVLNVPGGLITVPAQSCYAGTYVPLTVYSSQGYSLRNISLTDSAGNRVPVSYSGGQYWFTMPSSNVTIYAEFTQTVSAVPSSSSVSSKPVSRPEVSTQAPLILSVYASKSGSNGRPSSNGRLLYSINVVLSASVTGGTDCSYQFEIKQNGRLTRTTGWTSNSIFSGQLSGSGTCIAEITVKDSSGRTTTATLDLLGTSNSASSSSAGYTISSNPTRPSNSDSGTVSTTAPTSSPAADPLSISISNSAIKSISGSSYNIRLNLVAHATGGNGNYSYRFEILQNGEITETTDWSSYNAISCDLRGVGTCVVKIYAQDSSGESTSAMVDLLK